ncbi:hypothetical protein [Streptomyces sp. NPDC058280]|uniref:hypothetical protein n=1 Tax=Streptomyces sp. NPDC058280 TaxID=3346419 RepID=UPI0036EDB48C
MATHVDPLIPCAPTAWAEAVECAAAPVECGEEAEDASAVSAASACVLCDASVVCDAGVEP